MRWTGWVALLVAAPAGAYHSGITGFSGQRPGFDCNACHAGGSAPTVALRGPGTLDAGDTAEYTLTITGGAAVVGGLDVSVDNPAAQLQPGPGMLAFLGEVTHSTPGRFDGGSLSFTFSLVAPVAGGALTLFAAGNSCNGDALSTGDLAATAQLAVVVHGGSSDGGALTLYPAVGSDGHDALLGSEPGGCSAGGGAPVLACVLLAWRLLAPRRRRLGGAIHSLDGS
jgi:hypothetical protein